MLKNLKLKIKLTGSFIFIVFLTAVASYVGIRISLEKITEDVIPPLEIVSRASSLAKSMHVEVLEYVSTGEEEALQDLAEYTEELNALTEQLETSSASNSGETLISADLFRVTEEVSNLGQEIVQSRSQTLAHLEALHDLSEALETVFDDANAVVEAEIAKNLQEGDLDELSEDSIPTQQYLRDFIIEAQSLQVETIEFAALGEEESLEKFEEIEARLETVQGKLEAILEADELGEGELANSLAEIKEELKTRGQAVLDIHVQTFSLLEELEELETKLDETIATTQVAVDQGISQQLTEIDRNAIVSSLVMLVLAVALGLAVTHTVVKPVYQLVNAARQIGAGDFTIQAKVDVQDEIGELANSFNQMASNLRQIIKAEQQAKEEAEQARYEAEAANQTLESQIWQTSGQAQLNDQMRGEQDISSLTNRIIHHLCHYLQVQIGALYLVEGHNLRLAGSYAYSSHRSTDQFNFGEGLVGQAAVEKQRLIIADVPEEYITVRSGLGEIAPRQILIFPFIYEGQVLGVIELGTLTSFTPAQMDFIQTALEGIAVTFYTAQVRARINELLVETQQQAEELQAQGEELRVANEELASQTESLRASQDALKQKQAELEATNTQLEEKAGALEESSLVLQEKQAILDGQNQALKTAQQELEKRAEELALASKYKSEFLANMSHELRTPLNSQLILARMLAENSDGNLTEEQVESIKIIYGSGTDLLNLINDILDLSKVESGKMTFNFEAMPFTELDSLVRSQFSHVAEEKGIKLNIILSDDLPTSLETDPQRVKQIIKNLLSNAFKFTTAGSVSLNICRAETGASLSRNGSDPGEAIAISVIDTGIGMTAEQQKIIFEAFQQADGSTSRKYGGTGLGLSICRELALKLGGQIALESEPGKGSTFTLYMPISRRADQKQEKTETPEEVQTPTHSSPSASALPAPISPPDDRSHLAPGDKILVIIEDDPTFAKVLSEYAHQKGFKSLIATDGRTGLELVKSYRPEAITLDLHLPDISGWEVLELLKNEPGTRHIPIHIISADDESLDAYRKGVMGYLTKPVNQECLDEAFEKIEQVISRQIKSLLLVEDDANSRHSVKKLLGGSDVQISEADRGQTALELLKSQHFDCMILDLSLPDMSGFEVLNQINQDEQITKCPVIVYTGRELSPEENLELMKYADRVIVKGVKSPERLLDETALFLHRVVAQMPEDKQQTIKQLYNKDGLLKGKKILVVDDDMRNSFALSKLLSDKGIVVKIARDGQKALELLAQEPGVDLILMDIMMPVLDGYETTKQIRMQQRFKSLPILALTAKAMKEDREKCLAAGANDYLSKPVDVDRLFSMLRVWLYQ